LEAGGGGRCAGVQGRWLVQTHTGLGGQEAEEQVGGLDAGRFALEGRVQAQQSVGQLMDGEGEGDELANAGAHQIRGGWLIAMAVEGQSLDSGAQASIWRATFKARSTEATLMKRAGGRGRE